VSVTDTRLITLVLQSLTEADVKRAYRKRARECHPDTLRRRKRREAEAEAEVTKAGAGAGGGAGSSACNGSEPVVGVDDSQLTREFQRLGAAYEAILRVVSGE
jgi:hypothetical protein